MQGNTLTLPLLLHTLFLGGGSEKECLRFHAQDQLVLRLGQSFDLSDRNSSIRPYSFLLENVSLLIDGQKKLPRPKRVEVELEPESALLSF